MATLGILSVLCVIGIILFSPLILFKWARSGTYTSPDGEQVSEYSPAGRIHFFDGDKRVSSTANNPFMHQWLAEGLASGRLGLMDSEVLREHPAYQPSIAGTVKVYKPEEHFRSFSVIIDNNITERLGLERASVDWLPGSLTFHADEARRIIGGTPSLR